MAYIKCPKCGKILENSEEECPKCGHVFENEYEPWAKKLEKKQNREKFFFSIGLLISFALAVCFFVILDTDQNLVTSPSGVPVEEPNTVWFLLTVLFTSITIILVIFSIGVFYRKVMIATFDGRSVAVYKQFTNTQLWVNGKMVEKKPITGNVTFTALLPTGKHVFISLNREICTFELVEKEGEQE